MAVQGTDMCLCAQQTKNVRASITAPKKRKNISKFDANRDLPKKKHKPEHESASKPAGVTAQPSSSNANTQ